MGGGGGGGGEDEEEGEEEEENSPTCLSSIPDFPILLEEEEEEEEQGFGEEIGRGIRAIQGIDMVSMENSSHGGSGRGSGRGRGRGSSLQLFPRPTRKELVHLYLLRKRGSDKRCQDHLATWETTPHDCGMDLVSASIDSTGAQEKSSRMLLDDDEQDMPPSKRLRNRVKAQKARDRKMANLKNLELKVEALEKNNAELEELCSILQNDNQMLRNEVMGGDSSGKEELMRYYEGLEKEIKEDVRGKCDEIIDDELLEHDNGETLKSSNIVESSGLLVDNGEPFVGMKFESEMFAREFYTEYAWNLGFVTRTDKCRRSEKDGAIIWRKFVCSKEGFTRTKEKPNDGKTRRHRPSTRTGCPAFIEVTRKNDGQWAITKFHKEHNHRMFCKESEEWLLSNISLQENGINGGSVVRKEDLEVKSEIAEPSDTQLNVNEPYEGMIFVSEETAKQFYKEYGRQKGFAIRPDKCRRSEKNGAIIWRRFTCSKEGLFSIKEYGDDQKKRRRIRFSTRTGCLALLEITRKKDGNWTVSKFQRDHNHILSTTGEVHYCQYPRHILVDVKKGKSEDGFIGFLGKMQQMKDINGTDIHCLVAYLRHKQVDDPTFFFEVQAEKEEKLLNIVWVDARAYMAYSYFGDVLKVERSYTNYHYVPIVLLSGVNHHHQRVIFGCALLMDVNEESLEWLFTTWLRAMGGRHPVSVITDRDPILEAAVLKVLPDVHHRFDHWHILTQCKEKMPTLYKKNSTFKKELKDCIIHSESPEEFEPKWEKLVDGYNLGSNEWIQQLYETRKQWIPAFQRGTFFGELNIAMKMEPFEKLFGFHIHPCIDLHHLFLQFERVVDSLYEVEKQADSKSMDITPCLRTHSPLESQAAQVYTNEVFEVFQEHLSDAFAFKVVKLDDRSDGGSTYRLERYVRPGDVYTVQLRASETVASCSCRMFEFSGIPCSHVLAVLLFVQRPTLPDHYILRRWTKMANRGSDVDKTGGVR